jgi:long-subunit fatty acid transport protein
LITPDYTYIPLAANDFEYRVVSPFRGSLGGTVFINDNGFLTGTVEYIGYAGMRANTSYLDTPGNQNFKEGTNQEVKDTFRNTVNVRVGGEYRAGKFRARAGLGYIADPYVDRNAIDRSRLLYSLGAGVRGDRFFADLAGTLSTSKAAYTPYTLVDPAAYSSALISNKTVNVMLTVGAFF